MAHVKCAESPRASVAGNGGNKCGLDGRGGESPAGSAEDARHAVRRVAGASVASVQRALGIAAGGIWGPETRAAVRSYQRAHGLTVDGIAGPQTLGSPGLATNATATATATSASSGNAA